MAPAIYSQFSFPRCTTLIQLTRMFLFLAHDLTTHVPHFVQNSCIVVLSLADIFCPCFCTDWYNCSDILLSVLLAFICYRA